MVVIALLGSVCAATERPWHALCADPISGLASENSKSAEGSKSMYAQCTFFLMHTDAQEVKFHANDNNEGHTLRFD
jgi:hypothetical protein